MAHVSVILVNWNGKAYLERCLSSLLAQRYPDYDILLVDNNSQDGSVSYLQRAFPTVHVIPLRKNLGFAAGNNIGLEATDSPLVATLNTDTEVTADWLGALVAGMEADAGVGMCASKMLFFHRRDRINSTGIALDRAGIAWDRHGGVAEVEVADALREPFGPCAGAALYRRALLRQTGGFDPDYFYLYEDVDLAWRARWLGWHCCYCPDARVYHVHAGAGTEGTSWKHYLLARNRVWTIIKNYPIWPWLWRLPLLGVYDLGASAYGLIAQSDIQALRGRWDGYRSWSKRWNQRMQVQRHKVVSWRQVKSYMAPMASPTRILRRFRHLSR
jgi:hypothetical protein